MLDADLAVLYGVDTWNVSRAIRRNRSRFPGDFAFRLTGAEVQNLNRQIGGSSWGGRRKPPHALTEQGVAMLSGLLNSKRAIAVNVAIMRAFVQLRTMAAEHKELSMRLDDLESKYDGRFRMVFAAIRRLMAPATKPKRRIGFAP